MQVSVKDISDYVVAAMAAAAFVVSILSLVYARRSLRLAEEQDKRRQPRLVMNLVDSFFVPGVEGERAYCFRLTVQNPTDADNSISLLEMVVTYDVGGVEMSAKLGAAQDLVEDAGRRQQLAIPASIPAHGTVSGWCDFVIQSGTLGGPIDGYELLATDSHKAAAHLELSVVRERRDAS